MYAPISNRKPEQILRKIREKNPELYQVINETDKIIWAEIEEIYRLFDDRPGGKKGGAGGSGNTPKPSSSTKSLFSTLKLQYTSESLTPPTEIVSEYFWGNRNPRKYEYIKEPCELTGIGGVLRFADSTELVFEHFVELGIVGGSPILSPNTALGFDLGFERFNAERLKFFVDVFEFKTNPYVELDTSTNKTWSNINPQVRSSKKFRTPNSILSESQLADYNTGMRFECDLTLYLKSS